MNLSFVAFGRASGSLHIALKATASRTVLVGNKMSLWVTYAAYLQKGKF